MQKKSCELRVTGHPSQVIVLQDHLFFLFTQVVGHRDRKLAKELQPLKLSASKWRILGTLKSHNMLTMNELAEMTTIERTTLTRMLNQMEQEKIILRTSHADDKRATVVGLTRRGLELFIKANEIVEKVNEEIMLGLTDEETAFLRKIMQRLRQRTVSLLP